MAKLTWPELKFEFSPQGISDLCPELHPHLYNMLVDQLEMAWDESKFFEVEIEVPIWEEPYAYFLNVKVEPLDGQVIIERHY